MIGSVHPRSARTIVCRSDSDFGLLCCAKTTAAFEHTVEVTGIVKTVTTDLKNCAASNQRSLLAKIASKTRAGAQP